ncbi:hypothetical protein BDZ97DRAFT_836807 [Flammula alnicola]|nr:hypothetical protein BDZ97DRAFT_836807 [Flammula alnicola]
MSTELFHSSHVIPLWNPSPCKGHARTWRTHVYIGDVGIFNHDGGFDTLFNIFHSAAENRERKRDPPDDFIPYHKNLSEIGIDIQDLMLASSTTTMTSGFVKDPPHAKQSDDRSTDLVTIGFPDKVDSTECSAIHLADGYVKISINQWEMPRLTEYLREQREAWQRHMDKITAGQFHDRSFVVIVASYRAKTWALAGVDPGRP